MKRMLKMRKTTWILMVFKRNQRMLEDMNKKMKKTKILREDHSIRIENKKTMMTKRRNSHTILMY